MKLSYSDFRTRAFALTAWKKGDIGYGIPFWQLLDEGRYNNVDNTIVHKGKILTVSDVNITEEELEEEIC